MCPCQTSGRPVHTGGLPQGTWQTRAFSAPAASQVATLYTLCQLPRPAVQAQLGMMHLLTSVLSLRMHGLRHVLKLIVTCLHHVHWRWM